MKKQNLFTKRLLAWHEKNKVTFPWRETRDPYKVLVAEVLLVKTTRNQVKKVFEKLVARYPTPEILASAKTEELENLLRALGMHKKRAEILKKLATSIVEKFGGKVPDNFNDLVSLPGVGKYLANAVLCFAYGKRTPIVDTNVVRVVERVFGIKSEKKRPRNDPKIWSFVEQLTPRRRSREFGFALLDFANLICTQKNPKCSACPVKEICSWFGKKTLKKNGC